MSIVHTCLSNNKILIYFSRSSNSSSPRSGNQSSRTSGASSALPAGNTPVTPSVGNGTTTPQAPKKSSSGSTRRADEETPNSGGSGQPKVLLSELQSFLSGLQGGDSAAAGAGRSGVDLSTAINAEAVDKLATDEERTKLLASHLPTIETGDNAKKQLKDTISSPQFQQALSMFSTALQSGQLGPVVSQFQLNSDAIAAANTGDLEQFVKALEKSSTASAKGKEEKETDNATPMEEDKNA